MVGLFCSLFFVTVQYLLHEVCGRVDVLPKPYAVRHEVLPTGRCRIGARRDPERGGLVDLGALEVQRLLHPAERVALGRRQTDPAGLGLAVLHLAPEPAVLHSTQDSQPHPRHTCCQFLDKSDPRQNLVLF